MNWKASWKKMLSTIALGTCLMAVAGCGGDNQGGIC